MTDINQFAWIDKYAPQTIDELVATDEDKEDLRRMVALGKIADSLFVGPPGTGKTARAKLLCKLLDVDSMIVNASLKGNIDTLRNEVQQFAGTVSLSGAGKCAILDEADYLNAVSTQPALRNFIDTFRDNCSFILTANYGNRIIEPLKDRLEIHMFKVDRKDIPKLVMQMTKRCEYILQRESVEYDKEALARFVASRAPNWRSVLIALQRYARKYQKIDSGILAQSVSGSALSSLVPLFKARDFSGLRKWVGENADTSAQELFSEIVDAVEPYVEPSTLPSLYMIIARYQYQSAFVADQQINFAAAFAEIMTECVFT